MPNGSLVIHDVSTEDTGSYTCIAGNSCNIAHTSAELYVVGQSIYFCSKYALCYFTKYLYVSEQYFTQYINRSVHSSRLVVDCRWYCAWII